MPHIMIMILDIFSISKMSKAYRQMILYEIEWQFMYLTRIWALVDSFMLVNSIAITLFYFPFYSSLGCVLIDTNAVSGSLLMCLGAWSRFESYGRLWENSFQLLENCFLESSCFCRCRNQEIVCIGLSMEHCFEYVQALCERLYFL